VLVDLMGPPPASVLQHEQQLASQAAAAAAAAAAPAPDVPAARALLSAKGSVSFAPARLTRAPSLARISFLDNTDGGAGEL